jgi:hypothetical protein
VSWALQQVGERGPFDVIHAHSAVALACARLGPALPMVYTLHHARDEQLSAFYRYFQEPYYVAISEDQRRREIGLRHVHVIHHGLDPARYLCTPRPLGDYVCFVGRYAEVKGPHTAIDVARRAGVRDSDGGRGPPCLTWRGPSGAPAEARAGARDRRGPVGSAVKARLLAHARALIAPIEWNEPFGLILIEAMLSGCPVVAFGMGSVPELVEDGLTGYIATSAITWSSSFSREAPSTESTGSRAERALSSDSAPSAWWRITSRCTTHCRSRYRPAAPRVWLAHGGVAVTSRATSGKSSASDQVAARDVSPSDRPTISMATPSATRRFRATARRRSRIALTLKHDRLFALVDPAWQRGTAGNCSLGVFEAITRILSHYELRMAGSAPATLSTQVIQPYYSQIDLAVTDHEFDGNTWDPKHAIYIPARADPRRFNHASASRSRTFSCGPSTSGWSSTSAATLPTSSRCVGGSATSVGPFSRRSSSPSAVQFAYRDATVRVMTSAIQFADQPDSMEARKARWAFRLLPGTPVQLEWT